MLKIYEISLTSHDKDAQHYFNIQAPSIGYDSLPSPTDLENSTNV